MSLNNIMNFDDTRIAFEYLSDSQLKNAHFIFDKMSNPTLVNLGTKATLLALKLHLPISFILKKTVYQHFCGGETIEEVNRSVDIMKKYGIDVILNYGVEGKYSEEEFDNTAKSLHKTLQFAIQNKSITTISCKPSGLMAHNLLEKINAGLELTPDEKVRYDKGMKRLSDLAKAAMENKVSLHLDAEETWIQTAIDKIAFELSMEYNKTFPTIINGLQLYVKSKLDFLKESVEHGIENNYIPGLKLVRGAYIEKETERAKEMGYPNPICESLQATHDNYNNGLKYCVENIDKLFLCNASHNEYSCNYLAKLMEDNGIPKNHPRIYTAQLKGMSDNISFVMAKNGYNIQKYIAYGPVKQVIPYLIRRAQENTSVEGQTTRELDLIKQEIKRRK